MTGVIVFSSWPLVHGTGILLLWRTIYCMLCSAFFFLFLNLDLYKTKWCHWRRILPMNPSPTQMSCVVEKNLLLMRQYYKILVISDGFHQFSTDLINLLMEFRKGLTISGKINYFWLVFLTDLTVFLTIEFSIVFPTDFIEKSIWRSNFR